MKILFLFFSPLFFSPPLFFFNQALLLINAKHKMVNHNVFCFIPMLDYSWQVFWTNEQAVWLKPPKLSN